ncbi:hypothetical protein MMC16_001658 [Acarospora aff. strigata]|nr:hypothetical protein [Acarospora aff. strigata]
MEDTYGRPRVRIPPYEGKLDEFGHNAWAQRNQPPASGSTAQSTEGLKTGEATDESAETTQITPPTPNTPKSADSAALNLPKPRVQIQPATPLKSNAHRAITEPLRGSAVPKPLFAGRKVSIADLKHKFSKDSNPTNKGVGNTEIPPIPTVTTSKVVRALGSHPDGKKKVGKTPPSSAPASTNTPEPYRTSTDDTYPSRHGSPQRQVKSTPVPGPPTSRFFNENPQPRPSPSSQKTYETAQKDYTAAVSAADAIILGDGKLSPSKNGAYGRLANVEMQDPPARIRSMVGIVENVQYEIESGEGELAYPDEIESHELSRYMQQYDQSHLSANTLPPTLYSPSVYDNDSRGVSGGGWEALQHQYPTTLPPFSPHHPQQQHHSHSYPESQPQQSRDVSTGTAHSSNTNTLPFLFRGHPAEITPTSTTHSIYSDQNQLHNSFILPPPPPRPRPTAAAAAAAPPALYGNFVPTPPHPQFRPSSSSSQTLTSSLIDEHLHAFAMEIHHHIEMSSRRVLNALESRTDRLGDDVVRGFESLRDAQRESVGEICMRVGEEMVKGREEIEGVVRGGDERALREVRGVVRGGVEDVLGKLAGLVERVGVLEGRVGALVEVGLGGCRCGEGDGSGNGNGNGRKVGKDKDKEKAKPFHKRAFSSSANNPAQPQHPPPHPPQPQSQQISTTAITPRHPNNTNPNTHTTHAHKRSNTLNQPPPPPPPSTSSPLVIPQSQSPPKRTIFADNNTVSRYQPDPELNWSHSQRPAFHHNPQQQQHQHQHQHQHQQPSYSQHQHPLPQYQYGQAQSQAETQPNLQPQSQANLQWQWQADTGNGAENGFGIGIGNIDGNGNGNGRPRVMERQGKGEVVWQTPSWSDGSWYRQAYGS